jgi:hypothetical protein
MQVDRLLVQLQELMAMDYKDGWFPAAERTMLDTIAFLQQSKAQCPHGGDCACAISTRHEWFVAFCEERDKLRAQGGGI